MALQKIVQAVRNTILSFTIACETGSKILLASRVQFYS